MKPKLEVTPKHMCMEGGFDFLKFFQTGGSEFSHEIGRGW